MSEISLEPGPSDESPEAARRAEQRGSGPPAPPRILLQAREGTTVEISRGAADLCGLVAGILESVELDAAADAADAAILVPAPEVPDDRVASLAEFLELFAADARLRAFCEFLEHARQHDDAATLRLGLSALAGVRVVSERDKHTYYTTSRDLEEKFAALDYLGADLPLVQVCAELLEHRWMRRLYHGYEPAMTESARRGRAAMDDRFAGVASTWDGADRSTVEPLAPSPDDARLVRVPLMLAPCMLTPATAASWLCLTGDADTPPGHVQNKFFKRALGAALGRGGVKTLCIELETALSPTKFLNKFECQELVIIPRPRWRPRDGGGAVVVGEIVETVLWALNALDTSRRGKGCPRRVVVSMAGFHGYRRDNIEAAAALAELLHRRTSPSCCWEEAILDICPFYQIGGGDAERAEEHRHLAARVAQWDRVRPRAIMPAFTRGFVTEQDKLAEALGAEKVLYACLDNRDPLYPVAEFREFGAAAAAEPAPE